MTNFTKKLLLSKTFSVISLILLASAARLVPHPANFAPIAALALFGGATLKAPFSLIVPLASMVLSDLFIGFSPLPISLSVYGSFIVIVLMGRFLRNLKPLRILGVSISSSLIFFFITNAAVWWFSGMYAHTSAGLFQSYFFAIPFLRNTLLSDILYSFVLFYSFEVTLAIQNKIKRSQLKHVSTAENKLFEA